MVIMVMGMAIILLSFLKHDHFFSVSNWLYILCWFFNSIVTWPYCFNVLKVAKSKGEEKKKKEKDSDKEEDKEEKGDKKEKGEKKEQEKEKSEKEKKEVAVEECAEEIKVRIFYI